MPDPDNYSSLEGAVTAELRRLLFSTEIALRKAVGDETEVTDDDRWLVVADILKGFTDAFIKFARVVDHLERRIVDLERRIP